MTAKASAVARAKQPTEDHREPASVTPVFDLEAAAQAAADESQRAGIPFLLRGESFVVPSALDWPIEAQIELGKENLGEGLRIMMGDDEWERLLTVKPTIGELRALFQHVAKVNGVGDLGN